MFYSVLDQHGLLFCDRAPLNFQGFALCDI